jgi:CubicO group peptidase (beta-lactamase class C family)
MLGLLYLNRGILHGIQIVEEEWVNRTLTASTDNTHPNGWGAMKNYNYAWLWWLGQFGGEDMFMAYGYGGQFVVVFPDLDMIVVTTAEHAVHPDQSTVQEWALFDIIAENIVPAILN